MNVYPTLTKNYLEKQYQSHWLAIAAFTKSTVFESQLNGFQQKMFSIKFPYKALKYCCDPAWRINIQSYTSPPDIPEFDGFKALPFSS